MRVDLFLQHTRIIKRRSKIKELVEKKSLRANGKLIKSSYNIKVLDLLKIVQEKRIIEIQVLKLPQSEEDFKFSNQIFSVSIKNKENRFLTETDFPEVIDFLRRD